MSDKEIYTLSLFEAEDPFELDDCYFLNCPEKWPTINLVHIYQYLVEGKIYNT